MQLDKKQKHLENIYSQSSVYYQVKNSPRPFFLAVSLFFTTLLFINWIVSKQFFDVTSYCYSGLWRLSIGLLCFTLRNRIYDLIIESTYLGLFTLSVQQNFRTGFQLFILSETILFFAFFRTFFYFCLNPSPVLGSVRPPVGILPLNPRTIPLLNTFILLISGLFLTWMKVFLTKSSNGLLFPTSNPVLNEFNLNNYSRYGSFLAFRREFQFSYLFRFSTVRSFCVYKLINCGFWKFISCMWKLINKYVFKINGFFFNFKFFCPKIFFEQGSFSLNVVKLTWKQYFWIVCIHLFWGFIYFLRFIGFYVPYLLIQHKFGLKLLGRFLLLTCKYTKIIFSLYGLRSFFVTCCLALLITILLGVSFSLLQLYEYTVATFCINDSVYGSIFYILTGLHGLHVLGGTSFLVFNLGRLLCFHFTPTHHLSLDCAIWYRHFVDIVWICVFISIYWYGGF